jgi:hypothetical protein
MPKQTKEQLLALLKERGSLLHQARQLAEQIRPLAIQIAKGERLKEGKPQ